MEAGLRFLIVDDDEHAASKLGRLVEKAWFPGSSVVLAASEAAARAEILGAGEQHPAFDLVILDLQLRYDNEGGLHPDGLPERQAGIRLVSDIRGLGCTPVVLCSALGGENPRLEA